MKVRVMKTENPVEDKGTRLPIVPTLFPKYIIQSSQLCKVNKKENVLASCFRQFLMTCATKYTGLEGLLRVNPK